MLLNLFYSVKQKTGTKEKLFAYFLLIKVENLSIFYPYMRKFDKLTFNLLLCIYN